jgi:hypothetical protein
MIKFLWWELNVEEIFVGSMIQYPFIFIVGWWVIPLMAVSGLLWSIGGSKEGEKIIRRVGVALATALALVIYNHAYWPCLISGCGAAGAVWMGYGVNSVLYKAYSAILYTDKTRTFATRLTTYFLYWLAFGIGMHWVKV